MKPHHVFRFLNLFVTLVVSVSSFSQECNTALDMNTCSGATCTYRYAYVAESIPVSFSSLPIVDTSAAFPGLCGPPPPVMGIGGINGAIFSSLWVAITDSQVTSGQMSPYTPSSGATQNFLVTIPPSTTGLVGASSIRSVSAISGAPTAEMTLSGTSTLRFVDALNAPLRYVRWATSRADACLLAVANDPRTSIDVDSTVTTFNNASPVGLCSNTVLSQPVVSVCRPDLPYTPGVARFDVPPAASGECFNPCSTGATSLIGTFYAPLNQYLLGHNQSATFYPASAPNCANAGVIRTCNGQASLDGTSAILGSLSGPGTHTRPIGSCTSTCAAGTTLNWSQNGNNCSYTTATQGDLGDSSVVNDGGGSYIGSATLSCNAGGWAVTGGTCAPAGSDCWRALCGGTSNMYFSLSSFADAFDCEQQGNADYCVGGNPSVSCVQRTNDIACNGSTLCSPGSTSAAGCPVIANGDSRKTCAANGASWSACSSTCDAGYTSSGAQPGIACNNASNCNFSSSATCAVGGGCDVAAWNAFSFRVTGELQARGIVDPNTTYSAQYSSMGTKYNTDNDGANYGMSMGTTTNYTLGSNSVGLRVSWLGNETNLPGSFDVTVDGSVAGSCQATPGFCPPLRITWGGGNCRANFPSTANNTQSTAQTNVAAGYTGSARFRCNQGFWEVPTPVAGATCVASAAPTVACNGGTPGSFFEQLTTCSTPGNNPWSRPSNVTNLVSGSSVGNCPATLQQGEYCIENINNEVDWCIMSGSGRPLRETTYHYCLPASACGWEWDLTGGGNGNVTNSSNLCTGPAGGYGDATPEASAVCNATTNNGTNITCGDTGAAWNSYRCRNTCPPAGNVPFGWITGSVMDTSGGCGAMATCTAPDNGTSGWVNGVANSNAGFTGTADMNCYDSDPVVGNVATEVMSIRNAVCASTGLLTVGSCSTSTFSGPCSNTGNSCTANVVSNGTSVTTSITSNFGYSCSLTLTPGVTPYGGSNGCMFITGGGAGVLTINTTGSANGGSGGCSWSTPAVNCVGSWTTDSCASQNKRYVITTPASGGGTPCPYANNASPPAGVCSVVNSLPGCGQTPGNGAQFAYSAGGRTCYSACENMGGSQPYLCINNSTQMLTSEGSMNCGLATPGCETGGGLLIQWSDGTYQFQ